MKIKCPETHYFDDIIKFYEKYNIPLKDEQGNYRNVIDIITDLSNILYENEKENKNE